MRPTRISNSPCRPATGSALPTVPAEALEGLAWALAKMALAKPASADPERFLRGLLAVAAAGQEQS